MTKPDLQRHIQELNEALLLRNAIELKMVTDNTNSEYDYSEIPIGNHELTHRIKIETLLDEMLAHDECFYEAYAEYVVTEDEYDNLVEQHLDINVRIRTLKQRIARSICEYPATLHEIHGLMCQYGVKYLHNIGDVLEAVGTVYLEAPNEPSILIEGTHGGEYYIAPYENWSFDVKTSAWAYENPSMNYPKAKANRKL